MCQTNGSSIKVAMLLWSGHCARIAVSSLACIATAHAATSTFNIASQPMPSALLRFAEQSHMELLYTYDAVAGAMGRAVAGELDHRVAMAILLEDSGLEAVYSSDTSATIRVADQNGM